jgi:hypothetical protein
MGRNNIDQQTPDLFSTEGADNRSTNIASGTAVVRRPRRLILPKNLPNSIKYLDDRELDHLLEAAIDEAKRRGRPLASLEPGRTRTKVGPDEPKPKRPQSTGRPTGVRKIRLASSALTRGQVNAVRAAFKAGITPARIARQFGLSHADVRTALSSDE